MKCCLKGRGVFRPKKRKTDVSWKGVSFSETEPVKSGVVKKRSPHVLRHTFATAMLNNEAELGAVKELLGHSSLTTTEIYTHTTFEELKKFMNKLIQERKKGGIYGS